MSVEFVFSLLNALLTAKFKRYFLFFFLLNRRNSYWFDGGKFVYIPVAFSAIYKMSRSKMSLNQLCKFTNTTLLSEYIFMVHKKTANHHSSHPRSNQRIPWGYSDYSRKEKLVEANTPLKENINNTAMLIIWKYMVVPDGLRLYHRSSIDLVLVLYIGISKHNTVNMSKEDPLWSTRLLQYFCFLKEERKRKW